MRRFFQYSGLVFAGVALAACVSLEAPLSDDDGRATANNFAAQVIDKTPAEGLPKTDPALSEGAIERLRSGEVSGGDSGDESNAFIPIIDVQGSGT